MTADERLDKLELELAQSRRSIRWLTSVLGLVTLGLLALWVLVFSPRNIRVKGLEVVNDHGVTLTDIGHRGWSPYINLYDSRGETRFSLITGDLTAALRLEVEQSEIALDGHGRFLLKDENGNRRVHIWSTDNNAYFRMYNADRTDGTVLSCGDEGSGLAFQDGDQDDRIRISTCDPAPQILVADKDGNARAVLGAATFLNPDGTETKYPESTIVLLDENGRSIWRAPR